MKYRKKPVVIEAEQWTGDRNVMDSFIGLVEKPEEGNHAYYRDENKNQIIVKTLEGNMAADIGDWIIKGVKGEFYPCKPEIFEMTYEKVNN
jgi:hypothetical protein